MYSIFRCENIKTTSPQRSLFKLKQVKEMCITSSINRCSLNRGIRSRLFRSFISFWISSKLIINAKLFLKKILNNFPHCIFSTSFIQWFRFRCIRAHKKLENRRKNNESVLRSIVVCNNTGLNKSGITHSLELYTDLCVETENAGQDCHM